MIPPSIIAAIVAAILSAVGWILFRVWKWKNKIETKLSVIDGDIEMQQKKRQKIMSILFGREEDVKDDGLTEDIHEGFDELDKRVTKNRKRNEEVTRKVEILVLRLDEEEEIEFDKSDLESIVELSEADDSS